MKKSTGQASDTARWNSAGNLERVSGAVTGEVPTLGEYVLLKEKDLSILRWQWSLIIFACVCLEDPKATVPDSRFKASNTRYGRKTLNG